MGWLRPTLASLLLTAKAGSKTEQAPSQGLCKSDTDRLWGFMTRRFDGIVCLCSNVVTEATVRHEAGLSAQASAKQLICILNKVEAKQYMALQSWARRACTCHDVYACVDGLSPSATAMNRCRCVTV